MWMWRQMLFIDREYKASSYNALANVNGTGIAHILLVTPALFPSVLLLICY